MNRIQLSKIIKKYSPLRREDYDNYDIGGGLSEDKYASNRHEHAVMDKSKLTLGKATSLFVRATGDSKETVKAIIDLAVPHPEYHHAGLYNNRMKKTYFLNASEIVDIAENYDKYKQMLKTKEEKLNEAERLLEEKGIYMERVTNIPTYFIMTAKEMLGKYGWFPANPKYNSTIYYSGYDLQDEDTYNRYMELIN